MTVFLTMDAAGRLVLPKAFRDQLHLRQGARMKADLTGDKIELTPEPEENIKVIRKGKRLVISGVPKPFDAGLAVKVAREDYEQRLVKKNTKR